MVPNTCDVVKQFILLTVLLRNYTGNYCSRRYVTTISFKLPLFIWPIFMLHQGKYVF